MASKSSILSIVAWSLVVILLIGVGAMAFLNQKQVARADSIQEALLQVGTATGVEELSAASLADAEALSAMVQQLEGAILGDKQELAGTKDALSAAQTDASNAQAEVTSLNQSAADLKGKADELSKELAAKGEELDAANARIAEAEEARDKAEKAADKKIAKLEKKADGLKADLEEQTAALQVDLDAALARIAELESSSPEVMPEEALEEPVAEQEEAMDEASAEIEEEVLVEEDLPKDIGRVIGHSKMFALIRYMPESETLFLRLLDGQTLNYQGVPADVVDDLVTSEDSLDMKYRFKIQGVYKSLPPDSVVIRKYWKNERYNPPSQEVRLLEDEPLPDLEGNEVVVDEADEEVVVEEEAVAEE